MKIRSPIVSVLGHVDHGKTTLLDKIRGTSVAAGEPGAITQHVGASFVPIDAIEKKCKELIKRYKFKLSVPGLLFIDTPGHEAFTNLRKRGGSIADLAVLVVDITQGFQPQTIEALEILKAYKTPFVVAANKIDLLNGWIVKPDVCFADTFSSQREFVQNELDEKIYAFVRKLAEFGFDSERFDRVTDMTKQVLIIPVSAKTGEGFQDMLLLLAGLSQKFMGKILDVEMEKPAVGNVLEVKEVMGLGMTIDAIIYEGKIEVGDKIALASFDGPIVTKVKAILQPAPMEEIRDPKKKFSAINKVYAAAGIKIAAPGLEHAIPGSPLEVVGINEEKAKKEIEEEVDRIKIDKKNDGVIIKTDALGSLEAVTSLLKGTCPIRKADVGFVTRKDLAEAESVKKRDRYCGAIFAFNIKITHDITTEAHNMGIKIFHSNVIYRLNEEYEKWKKDEEKLEKKEVLGKYIYPAKIIIIPGYVFRTSKPAIVGVEVLGGILKPDTPLMNEDGETVGEVQSIQENNISIDKAEKGAKIAVSIKNATVNRTIFERQILFSAVPAAHLYALQDRFADKKLLEEIKKIVERR
jgi:translation initiation factor 5B